jgi:hypothetical protein
LEAITPFATRRMIKKQVKAGLLVAPISGWSFTGKPLWDSDQEEATSEEDLEYLRWELQEKKTLKPEAMRLLRGVVQMPFKERKNPDRHDFGDSDHDEEMLAQAREAKMKAGKGKVRPGLLSGKRLSGTELEMMKGLSKEDQQKKMNALAHEYSFFGVKQQVMEQRQGK